MVIYVSYIATIIMLSLREFHIALAPLTSCVSVVVLGFVAAGIETAIMC